MLYDLQPPYSLLRNRDLDFSTMMRLKRFARYWDLVANQGRFSQSLPILLSGEPFRRFLEFSDFLFQKESGTSGLSPTRLAEAILEFAGDTVRPFLERDFASNGRQAP